MSNEVFQELEKRSLGVVTGMHRAISEFDPEYVKVTMEFYHHYSLEREGSKLPRKIKELIIMSVPVGRD